MKDMISRLDWSGGWDDVTIELGRYENGETAFVLFTSELEPLTKPTVNLSEYDIHPAPDCFFIKDYSEHEGLGAALTIAGVVIPTGRAVGYGPYGATAAEYRFAEEYAANW